MSENVGTLQLNEGTVPEKNEPFSKVVESFP